MGVSFQPLLGVFRFGPEHLDWRKGDPYAGEVLWMLHPHPPFDLVHMFGVAGTGMNSDTRKSILELGRRPFAAIADTEFTRMHETRHARLIENDLITFRRKEVKP